MSLVGSSNYSGETPVFRMVYLVNSMIGMSVMSLALTYIMQIYNALQNRNAFGLSVHLMSRGTGDAAVLIQALGPDGQFSAGYNNLSSIAEAMVSIREAHEFYPVLFYFRFPEPCLLGVAHHIHRAGCRFVNPRCHTRWKKRMDQTYGVGRPAVGSFRFVA